MEIHWKFKDEEHAKNISGGIDYIVLDEGDKQCVRDNLLGAMFEQINNKPITKQFIRSLKHICITDYPEKFPILMDQILNYLAQNNPQSIYAGLLGLFALCSRYEFELDEDREPLFEIIKRCFDRMGELVNEMIINKENTDALFMMHLVCKVFYASNQL